MKVVKGLVGEDALALAPVVVRSALAEAAMVAVASIAVSAARRVRHLLHQDERPVGVAETVRLAKLVDGEHLMASESEDLIVRAHRTIGQTGREVERQRAILIVHHQLTLFEGDVGVLSVVLVGLGFRCGPRSVGAWQDSKSCDESGREC